MNDNNKISSFDMGSVLVRAAQLSDLDNLILLNKRYQKNVLEDFNNGFLTTAFHAKTFEISINNNDIVVCTLEQNLIGYYMTYNSDTKWIFSSYESFFTRNKNNQLLSHERVGIGAQAVISKEFQGLGLREIMLKCLIDIIKGKYDYLVSKVAVENIRAWKGHSKDGWKLIDSDENFHYVLLEL